jgi:MFS family permease
LTGVVHAGSQGRGPRSAVAVLGLVTIVAYGVAYYSYGVLIDPINADTGWSSAALGAIYSAVLVIGGIGGLAGGRLVDRTGTRPAFVLAGSVGAGGLAIASYQANLLAFAVFYAAGCGITAALGFYHITQPAAIRASASRPERAVVWLTILGAFSSPIFLPLTAALISAIGWRGTLRTQAILAAAAFLSAAVVSRHAHGQHPQGTRTGVRNAFTNAWRASGFRRWVLASLIGGAAVDVILVYQVPIMVAAGLSTAAAATIGGARGFAQLAGRLPLSPLIARLGARRTLVLALVIAAAGTLLLLIGGVIPASVAYSILAGASIGAIYTLQGIYTHELVGAQDLSMLMGAQNAVFAVGGAAGPLLAGVLFEAKHSYTPGCPAHRRRLSHLGGDPGHVQAVTQQTVSQAGST